MHKDLCNYALKMKYELFYTRTNMYNINIGAAALRNFNKLIHVTI